VRNVSSFIINIALVRFCGVTCPEVDQLYPLIRVKCAQLWLIPQRLIVCSNSVELTGQFSVVLYFSFVEIDGNEFRRVCMVTELQRLLRQTLR